MKNIQLAANIAEINDNSRAFVGFNPNGKSGLVMAANDANFDAAHLSEPLTEFLVDYPDMEGLDALLEAAAPSVMVGRSFSYLTADSASAFQLDADNADVREIGGSFAEVSRKGTKVDGRTDNKGLITYLDNDSGGEDPAVQQSTVNNLRNRLLRTELYRLNVLLDANDTASASSNWKASGADPEADILSNIDLGGDARGIDSNIVIYGGGAWTKRLMSLGLDTNAARYASRTLTKEQLADLLGVDKVLVSKFRYQNAAATKTKIIADNVWIYYVKPGASKDDPSNIKRFLTPVPGGGMFRVYIQPVLKRTAVAVEHYSRLACTSTLGIYKQAVTYT